MSQTESQSVLLVSTHRATREELQHHLSEDGYGVLTTEFPSNCLLLLSRKTIHLAIVDTASWDSVVPPWGICQQICAVTGVPLIVIVSNSQEVQQALEIGADHAMTRPVHLRETAARVRALLRRTSVEPPRWKTDLYLDRDFLIDFETHEVWVRGQQIHFTPQEYALLATMARHAGQILSPEQLVWNAWAEPASGTLLKQYVWRLRQKIEQNPRKPEVIITHRQQGYEFRRIWQER